MLTDAQINELTKSGSSFYSDVVLTFDVLADRMQRLEARIKDLEARGELKYCGIWREGDEYARGNFVTTNGSLWHAEAKTTSRPGTDSTWRLAVKQGTASR